MTVDDKVNSFPLMRPNYKEAPEKLAPCFWQAVSDLGYHCREPGWPGQGYGISLHWKVSCLVGVWWWSPHNVIRAVHHWKLVWRRTRGPCAAGQRCSAFLNPVSLRLDIPLCGSLCKCFLRKCSISTSDKCSTHNLESCACVVVPQRNSSLKTGTWICKL